MIKFKRKYTLLLGIGMIVNSNYIGTILSGLIQEVKLLEKLYSKKSILKNDRTAHLVVHSLLKELYYNGFF